MKQWRVVDLSRVIMCTEFFRNKRQQVSVWPVQQAIKLADKEIFHNIVICDVTSRSPSRHYESMTEIKRALQMVFSRSAKQKMRVEKQISYIAVANITTPFRFYDKAQVLLLKKKTHTDHDMNIKEYAQGIVTAIALGQ